MTRDSQSPPPGDATKIPVFDMPVRYVVSALPEDHFERDMFEIHVDYRGSGLWTAGRAGRWLNISGGWDYPQDQGHTEAWRATHRYDLDTALRLARAAAPHLTCNGWTVARVLAERPTDEEGKDG